MIQASMPSPSDIRYFMEVASTGNLSRAAERIGITQPSLTLSIQRLEHAIGTPLLIRSKKGVSVTQAGKQLLTRGKDLLQQWENLRSHALSSTNEVQGHYNIGCHSSIALYSAPHFVADLLESNPKLEIKLTHDLSRKIAERVITMEIDIGIVVNPVKHPDLVIKKLCSDEVTFWTGRSKHSVQDFKSGEAVLISDMDITQSQSLLKQLKKSGGIGFKRILTTSSLETITELVASGAGIGIIPSRVVMAMEHSSHIKRLQKIPNAPVFKDEIYLVYRVENRNIQSIQVIAKAISKVF